MNLFVLAWNISTELIPVAINELRQMVDVYPQLDPDTIWHWKGSGGAFAASMHVSAQAAAPRIYVSRNSDGVTFYDGSVVVPQSNFNAHDAVFELSDAAILKHTRCQIGKRLGHHNSRVNLLPISTK